MASLVRFALQMMNRLTVNRRRFRILEFLDVFLRELRAIYLNRKLVELGSERERRLVVFIVDTSQRVGADIEALVPLQDHRQGVRHGDGLNFLAVHLERSGARTTETTHVIEGKCAQAQAVVLEVELQRMFAGRESAWAFPLDAFQVN